MSPLFHIGIIRVIEMIQNTGIIKAIKIMWIEETTEIIGNHSRHTDAWNHGNLGIIWIIRILQRNHKNHRSHLKSWEVIESFGIFESRTSLKGTHGLTSEEGKASPVQQKTETSQKTFSLRYHLPPGLPSRAHAPTFAQSQTRTHPMPPRSPSSHHLRAVPPDDRMVRTAAPHIQVYSGCKIGHLLAYIIDLVYRLLTARKAVSRQSNNR